MIRLFIAISVVSLLSGCTALPDLALFGPWRGADNKVEAASYRFSWRLSGDRAVAPLQVFDDGRQMWLQFAPDQAIPAIFVNAEGAQGRPLPYRQEGAYVVLPGVWPSLVLRGGQLKSFIDQIEKTPELPFSGDRSPSPPQASAPVPLPAAQVVSIASQVPVSAVTPLSETLPADFTASSFALAEEHTASFTVGPQDHNLRVALSRWAQAAGWTFEAEHWAVDADIPIVGSASFEPQFKRAVQQLVASTELADRPLQPCFYSNKVLRIVPYAQSCDRTANLPEVS